MIPVGPMTAIRPRRRWSSTSQSSTLPANSDDAAVLPAPMKGSSQPLSVAHGRTTGARATTRGAPRSPPCRDRPRRCSGSHRRVHLPHRILRHFLLRIENVRVAPLPGSCAHPFPGRPLIPVHIRQLAVRAPATSLCRRMIHSHRITPPTAAASADRISTLFSGVEDRGRSRQRRHRAVVGRDQQPWRCSRRPPRPRRRQQVERPSAAEETEQREGEEQAVRHREDQIDSHLRPGVDGPRARVESTSAPNNAAACSGLYHRLVSRSSRPPNRTSRHSNAAQRSTASVVSATTRHVASRCSTGRMPSRMAATNSASRPARLAVQTTDFPSPLRRGGPPRASVRREGAGPQDFTPRWERQPPSSFRRRRYAHGPRRPPPHVAGGARQAYDGASRLRPSRGRRRHLRRANAAGFGVAAHCAPRWPAGRH